MRIALANIGAASWVGGIYPVGNLIRALGTLPAADRPELTLLVSRKGDRRLFDDIEGRAEVLRFPSLGARIVRRTARMVDGWRGGNGHRVNAEEQLDRRLNRELTRRRVALLFPCARSLGMEFSIPWIGWTADLPCYRHPEYFPESERTARELTLARLTEEARVIIVSSREVARDLMEAFPASDASIKVVNFRTVPLRRWFARDPAQTCARFDLPGRFLVLPNQFFVHKNHRAAFEAVRILKDRGTDINLVCTGATEDWRRPEHFSTLTEFIEKHHLADRIRIVGLLPRDQQVQVLRRAIAVVQPSFFEGWNSVLEDARALGKQAIVSDIPVHREHALPSATYFEPNDPEELAAAMERAWFHFSPGPCLPEEGSALARQRRLVAQYANDFMEAAYEAVRTMTLVRRKAGRHPAIGSSTSQTPGTWYDAL